MKVWLLNTGEPLPIDPGNPRLLRAGLVAAVLSEAGHDVTWWTSTFIHSTKRHRAEGPREDELTARYRILQLHGEAYHRHVSLVRVRHQEQIASQFLASAERRDRPDLILCSYPTIELAVAAVQYGRLHATPVVIDVRDLHPDIFLDILPAAIRSLGRLALRGQFRRKRFAMRQAKAVIGVSEGFVDWGVRAAERARGVLDRAFVQAYPITALRAEQRAASVAFWRAHFHGDPPAQIVCFFGNFSDHVLDMHTVIRAARQLEHAGHKIHFVLCGTGPSWHETREEARDLQTVTFPGFIAANEIRGLMELSLAGLVPYAPRWDFELTIPTKAVEYLSGGLPIITCLKGALAQLIARTGCGAMYESGSASALARVLLEVVADMSGLARMEELARTLFERDFRADRIYADYVAHLGHIAESVAAR